MQSGVRTQMGSTVDQRMVAVHGSLSTMGNSNQHYMHSVEGSYSSFLYTVGIVLLSSYCKENKRIRCLQNLLFPSATLYFISTEYLYFISNSENAYFIL
jgi:hypothetical protein